MNNFSTPLYGVFHKGKLLGAFPDEYEAIDFLIERFISSDETLNEMYLYAEDLSSSSKKAIKNILTHMWRMGGNLFQFWYIQKGQFKNE